jgi:hypothetical protein
MACPPRGSTGGLNDFIVWLEAGLVKYLFYSFSKTDKIFPAGSLNQAIFGP